LFFQGEFKIDTSRIIMIGVLDDIGTSFVNSQFQGIGEVVFLRERGGVFEQGVEARPDNG
jgi:hypothetical protein